MIFYCWAVDKCSCSTERTRRKFKTLPEAQRTQKLTRLNSATTCLRCIFGHQIALLALVAYMATRWRHLHYWQIWPSEASHLHYLQIGPPSVTTCIGSTVGHQVAPLFPKLSTRLRHTACIMLVMHCLPLVRDFWICPFCLRAKDTAETGHCALGW